MLTSPLSPQDYESKVARLDFILAPSFMLDRPPDGLCQHNISHKAPKTSSQAETWLPVFLGSWNLWWSLCCKFDNLNTFCVSVHIRVLFDILFLFRFSSLFHLHTIYKICMASLTATQNRCWSELNVKYVLVFEDDEEVVSGEAAGSRGLR